jgi:hypothetical protein
MAGFCPRETSVDFRTCDFLVAITARFRILYVFVAMEVESRRILHFNVTPRPSAEWTLQQLIELAWSIERHIELAQRFRDRTIPILESVGLSGPGFHVKMELLVSTPGDRILAQYNNHPFIALTSRHFVDQNGNRETACFCGG